MGVFTIHLILLGLIFPVALIFVKIEALLIDIYSNKGYSYFFAAQFFSGLKLLYFAVLICYSSIDAVIISVICASATYRMHFH